MADSRAARSVVIDVDSSWLYKRLQENNGAPDGSFTEDYWWACKGPLLLTLGIAISLVAVGVAYLGSRPSQIERLETEIRSHPGVFSFEAHNTLRHLYSVENPPDMRRSFEHINTILQHSVLEEYTMKILSGWQWGKDDAVAQINLRKNAEKYPDLQFVASASNVLIGDLYLKLRDFGNARAAYERVAKNPDAGEYKRLAQQRLDELRKISSRRS